jgi:hypothetical protein
MTGDRGPTGPPGPTGNVDIHAIIRELVYQTNQGVYSTDMWTLIRRLSLRITGTGPMGPTSPTGPTGPTRALEDGEPYGDATDGGASEDE